MPDITIVIGTGISAAAYLTSLAGQLGTVRVFGGTHLWQNMAPDHRMGQPAPLLRGNLLPGSRAYEDPHLAHSSGFMLSQAFETLVNEQIRRNSACQIAGTMVTAIERTRVGRLKYKVSVLAFGVTCTFYCHNLVIATGPGPSRPLTAGDDGRVPVDPAAFGGHIVSGTEFMSPNWRMPWPSARGQLVAVYGGSATASWAVELAAIREMRVDCWFTRPGSGGGAWDARARFRDAFPAGGRNAQVERDFENVRKVLKLVDVELRHSDTGSYLALKLVPESGVSYWLLVDLLVYALGSQHTADTGVRALLGDGIEDQLVAYWDRNCAISSTPSLLAIGTEDRSLMIVGSAMSSSAGFGAAELSVQGHPDLAMDRLASYAQISSTLPPAARPTEGIAMIMASIEALNHYIPATPVWGSAAIYRTPDLLTQPRGRGTANPDAGRLTAHATEFDWDINVNTSNRTQLAVFLAQTSDLAPLAANLAVALAVSLRTKSVFGLTNEQFLFIATVADACAEIHREAGMEADRFEIETRERNGVDQYLDMLVNHLTRGEFVDFWERRGIQCH